MQNLQMLLESLQKPVATEKSKEDSLSARLIEGFDSKKFKDTLRKMKFRDLPRSARLRPAPSRRAEAPSGKKRSIRINELQKIILQLKLKLKDSQDKDVLYAQLSMAQNELFGLMVKYSPSN